MCLQGTSRIMLTRQAALRGLARENQNRPGTLLVFAKRQAGPPGPDDLLATMAGRAGGYLLVRWLTVAIRRSVAHAHADPSLRSGIHTGCRTQLKVCTAERSEASARAVSTGSYPENPVPAHLPIPPYGREYTPDEEPDSKCVLQSAAKHLPVRWLTVAIRRSVAHAHADPSLRSGVQTGWRTLPQVCTIGSETHWTPA
jgi:hypothetical protein